MLRAPIVERVVAGGAIDSATSRRPLRRTAPGHFARYGRTGLLVATLWASSGCGASSESVSPREQRELPTVSYSLVQDLCFKGDSRFDRGYAKQANARAKREFVALERSLRVHPDARVRVRFTPADSPDTEIRELSVRELVEIHVDGARNVGLPNEMACYRAGRARLERALDAAG